MCAINEDIPPHPSPQEVRVTLICMQILLNKVIASWLATLQGRWCHSEKKKLQFKFNADTYNPATPPQIFAAWQCPRWIWLSDSLLERCSFPRRKPPWLFPKLPLNWPGLILPRRRDSSCAVCVEGGAKCTHFLSRWIICLVELR